MSDDYNCPHCGKPILSVRAWEDLQYARREAPRRGGYIWEGARIGYEAGDYHSSTFDELLACGALTPHRDPAKGWVPS